MSSAADSQAFEMSLRDQLIAAQNNHVPPPTQQHQPLVHAPTASPYGPQQTQQPSHHHHHDQVMAIQSYGMPHQGAHLAHAHGDGANPNTQAVAPAKKGRGQRELSNTKRAAQNRAAQRAFRMRKEQHINKLQDDIKKFETAEHNFNIVQHENTALRDYITQLHARMSEKNISYPPAPEPLPLRSADLSTEDNHSPLHDQDHAYQPPQNVQHHHYPDNSPPQNHAAVQHVYPPPSHTPSLDQHHHRHDPPVHAQPTHHDSTNDPLPPGAISQLQAAAAQAGDMDRPHAPSPTHRDHHQQAHPQDAQYVRASEYPAHKRPRLGDSPARQTLPIDKPAA